MKTDNHIFIIGTGGHSEVIIDTIQELKQFDTISIIDFYSVKEKFCGIKIIHNENELSKCLQSYKIITIFVAIGENVIRKKEVELLKKYGQKIEFPSIIHPSAIISKKAIIGQGSFIGTRVIINTGSSIGDFTIINSGASIDHGCTIGSYSSIGPGVTMGGNVSVGNKTHIGLGSNILELINIPDETLIGAGSLIVKDIQRGGVYFGSPATYIKKYIFQDMIYGHSQK